MLLEEQFELLGDDVPERHLAGNLDPVHLELARNRAGCCGYLRMPDHGQISRIFCHKRQHGHQVRLTSPVVADDQNPLVVHALVKRKLWDHLVRDAFGHVVGNDVSRDQLLGFFGPIGIEKLNDRLDLLELNEIAIMHGHTRFLSTYFK